nr:MULTISPECIES: MarR family transcriptional regulator [unclassified Bradyrhizobium]
MNVGARARAEVTDPAAAGLDWDLQATPAPLVNSAARALTRLAERRLRPLGLSASQMPVLYLLRDGGAVAQKDLARFARIEQPSMAQLLARMERDGLIRRSPDPADGRSSLVSLTRAAQARLPAARAALKTGRADMLAGFASEDVDTLRRLLIRLNDNLARMVESEAED